MNHGKHIIATTFADGFTYEDYVDYCIDNDVVPKKDDSPEFYEWRQEETDLNFESDMDNIKECEEYNVPVVVTGLLGLWDGSHEILPRKFGSVYEAIQAAFSRSIDNIIAVWDDGEISVHSYHHDGMNRFTINKLAEEAWDKEEGFTSDDVERLPYLYDINQ